MLDQRLTLLGQFFVMDDKKTIALLREQLKVAQEEIEFLKRKYKMMWGKVVDSKPKEGIED